MTPEHLRERLLQQGFLELQADTFDEVAAGIGNLVVLPLDSPAQRPEFFDLTVVLPEILSQFPRDTFRAAFVSPPASATIAKRFGVLRHPALIFLREGRYVGTIEGLRDWQDYRQSFARLGTEPPRPVPVPLTVSGARR